MEKLLKTYKALPNPTNRQRLQNYLNKHMMAVCMATPEQLNFLKLNEFKI